ncbi:MAG: lycopene cyclase domain-containing protein [bacterium]|nr:lycopene cyclase domain-containing protein [bacterium]
MRSGVGGLAVIIYEWVHKVKHKQISKTEQHLPRHKYHLPILLAAPFIFILLLIFVDINPIYSAVIAMLVGGIFTWYCRPDLKKKMVTSALLFLGIYFLYFLTLEIAFPGYVQEVWNFSSISGVLILKVPLEELMFAFSLGFLWSSVYEHLAWRKINY